MSNVNINRLMIVAAFREIQSAYDEVGVDLDPAYTIDMLMTEAELVKADFNYDFVLAKVQAKVVEMKAEMKDGSRFTVVLE